MTDAQKTPLVKSFPIAVDKRTLSIVQAMGKALPASVTAVSGSIVTVKFELQSKYTLPQVTVPLFGPEYIRYPIQVGCKGVVFPADVSLKAMSGLGDGVAEIGDTANLTSLVFFPVGNTGFSVVDANTLTLYGEPDVFIKDKTGAAQVLVSPDQISLSLGSASIVITDGTVSIEGALSIGGHSYLSHRHTDVKAGADISGPVDP